MDSIRDAIKLNNLTTVEQVTQYTKAGGSHSLKLFQTNQLFANHAYDMAVMKNENTTSLISCVLLEKKWKLEQSAATSIL